MCARWWWLCCLRWPGAGQAALSQGAACAKADFEAVVNAAGAALRDLAQQNTPQFQAKLRQLKDKRSWSNDEFLKQAEPLVRDETIAGYDKKSEELVARITGGGGRSEVGDGARLHPPHRPAGRPQAAGGDPAGEMDAHARQGGARSWRSRVSMPR